LQLCCCRWVFLWPVRGLYLDWIHWEKWMGLPACPLWNPEACWCVTLVLCWARVPSHGLGLVPGRARRRGGIWGLVNVGLTADVSGPQVLQYTCIVPLGPQIRALLCSAIAWSLDGWHVSLLHVSHPKHRGGHPYRPFLCDWLGGCNLFVAGQ